MANDNQLTEEEIEAQKKESARKMQFMIHGDQNVSLTYANALARSGAYGSETVDYSKDGALKALKSGSFGVGQLVLDSWNQLAGKEGADLESLSLSAGAIIENTQPFLYKGIDSMKAQDLLDIMQSGGEGLKKITDEEQGMYMSDLKDANPDVYNALDAGYKKTKRLGAIQMTYGIPLNDIRQEWSEKAEVEDDSE